MDREQLKQNSSRWYGMVEIQICKTVTILPRVRGSDCANTKEQSPNTAFKHSIT